MAPDAKLPDDVTIVDADERPASAVDIHEEYVESQAEADKALEEIEEEAPIGADEDVPDSAGPGLEEADEEADEAEEDAEEAAEEPEPEPEPEPEEAEEPTPAVGEHELTDISGVGPATAETLADEGYDVAQIADASAEDLTEVAGIGEKTAESIKEATDELVGGEP
jgi:predicted flap endonuclease-1-like 5' DNA nuclease